MITNDLLVKGSARIVDKIYANKIEGDLIGNADTATKATSADWASGASYSNMLKKQTKVSTQAEMDAFGNVDGIQYTLFKSDDQSEFTNFSSCDGMLLSIPWSADYGTQLAFDDTKSANVFVRGKGTTWGSWYKLLHSGNYSSYALPLTGGTLSGSLTLSSGSVTAGTFASSNTLTLNSSSTIYTDRGASTSYVFKKGGTEHARFDTSGHFIPGADSTYNIGASGNCWLNVYADNFHGYLNGNAATATALTTNAGDSNTPVYFSGGKPVACTSLDLNTTGNAATATKAYILQGTYTSNGGAQPPSYVGANSVKCNMMNNFVGTDVSFSSYADVLMMNAYSWSDVPYATALAIQKTNGIPRAWIAAGGNTDAWSGATEIITKNNIGSQSVSSATKATQDASGNTITSTYATKTELANKVKIVRW